MLEVLPRCIEMINEYVGHAWPWSNVIYHWGRFVRRELSKAGWHTWLRKDDLKDESGSGRGDNRKGRSVLLESKSGK